MKRQLPSLEDSMRILQTTHTLRTPKPPPPINRRISPIIKQLSTRFSAVDTGIGSLKLRWVEIVGAALARLCEPIKIIKGIQSKAKPSDASAQASAQASGQATGQASSAKSGGILEIRCEGVYAPLLQHQSELILGRVNLFLGTGSVKKLRLIQGRINQNDEKKPPPSRQPLNAQDDLQLQQSLNDVDDERLKQTLLKLGRSILINKGTRQTDMP